MHRQTNKGVQAALFSGESGSGEDIPPPNIETPMSDGIPRSTTSRPSDLGAVTSGTTAPAISPDLLVHGEHRLRCREGNGSTSSFLMFRAPNMSLAMSCSDIAGNLAAPPCGVGSLLTINPSLPLHPDQPFLVCPGCSPDPAKLVAQIADGKFIELSDLISANLQQSEPKPQLLSDGHLVLMAPPENKDAALRT